MKVCHYCHSTANLMGSICIPCSKQYSVGNFKKPTRYKYQPEDKVWYWENGRYYLSEIMSYDNQCIFDKGRTIIKITDPNYLPKYLSVNDSLKIPSNHIVSVNYNYISPLNSQQEKDHVKYILVPYGQNPEFEKLSPLLGDVFVQAKFQVDDIVLFNNRHCTIIEVDTSLKYSEFIYILKDNSDPDCPLLLTQCNPFEFTKV